MYTSLCLCRIDLWVSVHFAVVLLEKCSGSGGLRLVLSWGWRDGAVGQSAYALAE